MIRRRFARLVGALCPGLATPRGHYRLVVAVIAGVILAAVLFPALLSLDFCSWSNDEVWDEGYELLCLLAHAIGHAAERMTHVLVVLETVVPDEVQVVDKVGLGLVLETLELFGHGTQVHGLLDEIVVVGRIPLVHPIQERG